MFNKITLSNPETEYQLEYFNAIGLLFRNQLFLNKNNNLVEFEIKEIKSVYFKKERDLSHNYILFVIACSLFALSLSFSPKIALYPQIGIGIALALLVYAILKRTYAYSIVLFTNYSHIFSIPVNPQDKEDACELLARTKRKLKTQKKFMQAS
jgi:hypothetical protein